MYGQEVTVKVYAAEGHDSNQLMHVNATWRVDNMFNESPRKKGHYVNYDPTKVATDEEAFK
jgi:hypothetical protein